MWLIVINGRQRNAKNVHIWGKKNDSNYDGTCTARHCLSGTYEISRRWIIVRLSVQTTLRQTHYRILYIRRSHTHIRNIEHNRPASAVNMPNMTIIKCSTNGKTLLYEIQTNNVTDSYRSVRLHQTTFFSTWGATQTSGYVPTHIHKTSFWKQRFHDKFYLHTFAMRLRSAIRNDQDGAPVPGRSKWR